MKIVTDNVKFCTIVEIPSSSYNRDATHKALFVSEKGETLEVLYKNPSSDFIESLVNSVGFKPIELYINTKRQSFFGKGDLKNG